MDGITPRMRLEDLLAEMVAEESRDERQALCAKAYRLLSQIDRPANGPPIERRWPSVATHDPGKGYR